MLRLKCFLLFSSGSTSIKPTRAGEENEEPSISSAKLPPTEAADSRSSPPRGVILKPLEEGEEDKEDIFCPSRYVRGVAMEEETASRALLKLVSVVTIRLPTKLITPSYASTKEAADFLKSLPTTDAEGTAEAPPETEAREEGRVETICCCCRC